MKYEKSEPRKSIHKAFEEGVHTATIQKIGKRKSKEKKLNQFVLTLEGKKGETIDYFLTFDTAYTHTNLNYLLGSIESNGVEIPDESFGFNRETQNFLTKKQVFIKVVKEKQKGANKLVAKSFLLKEEYQDHHF